MEEINIADFLRFLKKYVVVIVMITLVCVLGTIIYDVAIKTPKYTTYTTVILVQNATNSASDDTITQNDLVLNQKLVDTYQEIIKSRLVLEQVIKKLGLNYSYSEIQKEVSVTSQEDTEILKISVTDRNAESAAKIANMAAEVFNDEITKIYNINNVSVIDTAQVPVNPSNNSTIRDIVLAVFVGIVGSTAVVFIIFYFDDTLRYTDNMENDIEMPVIAKVFKDDSGVELVVDKKPKALASESIRNLRTNLQFASVDKKLQTILVTSTIPSEGKSFISANLAVSFAQAGKKVLLIDCDLRKGRQHKIFKVSSKHGLSNLLIGDIKNAFDYINETKTPNLYVISRGTFPPNPSELLNSKKNATLIEKLKEKFDIIILDGAPISGLSDSLILSSLVDEVVLVSSLNFTPKKDLKAAKKDLENVGAHIAGCVVNKINVKKDAYGSYYYYHYGYGYGYGDKTKS